MIRSTLDWLFPSIRGRQRNQLVDVLRGISILMVLFSHLTALDHLWSGSHLKVFGRDLPDIREGMGYFGVSAFFVISGFLITQVTLRRYQTLNRIDCSAFWWMRFSRIMPMLLACLAAMILFHSLPIGRFHFVDSAKLWKDVTAALSFRFNDVLGPDPGQAAWNPMWSLSVEEIFYLVFPFVCLAINGLPAAVWVGVPLIGTAVFLRLTGQANPYEATGCMDLLTLGCLVAAFRPERLRPSLRPWATAAIGIVCGLAGLAIMALVVLAWHPIRNAEWSSLACGTGAALALVSSQILDAPPALRIVLRPVSTLGVISYELYLIHMPLAVMLSPVLPQNSWLLPILAIVLAILVHECFSEPMNRTLRALGPGASPGPAPRIRTAAQNRLRCLALSAGALAVIGSVGATAAVRDEPSLAEFRIMSVAALPNGSTEPLIYAGRREAGDLVYLKHEAGGTVRLAIDHWGIGGPSSGLLPSRDITGGLFKVIFSGNGLTVTYDGKTILHSAQGCFNPSKVSLVGVNDAGFSTAPSAAASTIIDCR